MNLKYDLLYSFIAIHFLEIAQSQASEFLKTCYNSSLEGKFKDILR